MTYLDYLTVSEPLANSKRIWLFNLNLISQTLSAFKLYSGIGVARLFLLMGAITPELTVSRSLWAGVHSTDT